MSNPLMDKDFLKQLDLHKNKIIYAKVISLNDKEEPIEQIDGKVTGGSITVDGNSAVRRTCSLTMVTDEVDFGGYQWSLNTKFQLYVGIENEFNDDYEKIIWFKQGTFVITSFGSSLNFSTYTISLSGQDKMCLLNGTIGGILPASIDFRSIEVEHNGYVEKVFSESSAYLAHTYYIYNQQKKQFILSDEPYNENTTYYEKETIIDKTNLPIKTIVREAVHTYGGEPYHNIIINDIDDYGLSLMEYRQKEPLYFIMSNNICEQVELNGKSSCYILKQDLDEKLYQAYREVFLEELNYILNSDEKEKEELVQKLNNSFLSKVIESHGDDGNAVSLDSGLIEYNTLVEDYNIEPSRVIFPFDLNLGISSYYQDSLYKPYTVAKMEYGEAAGYKQVDLTYPDELVSAVGETLTSILDKIKSIFTDFEYFYDRDGRFIFQKSKNYLNTSWNNIIDDGTKDDSIYVDNTVQSSANQYSFEGNELIIQIGHNPRIEQLKNDFSVWGVRKGVSGADINIHARYAIDKKPEVYKTFPRVNFDPLNDTNTLVVVTNETESRIKYLEQDVYIAIGSDKYKELAQWTEYADNEQLEEPVWSVPDQEYDYTPVEFNYFASREEESDVYAGSIIYYHYCDWREIIYQMALDYYKFNQFDEFNYYLSLFNPQYENGKTGYERYYIDMQGFWRQLYNPNPDIDFEHSKGDFSIGYKWDEENKKLIEEKDQWQNIEFDYSNLICDFYLPEYQEKQYSEKLENIEKTIDDKITEWESHKEELQESGQDELEDLNKQEEELQKLNKEYEDLIKDRMNDTSVKEAEKQLAEANEELDKVKETIENDIYIYKGNNIEVILQEFGLI